jgi:hypothetical protein
LWSNGLLRSVVAAAKCAPGYGEILEFSCRFFLWIGALVTPGHDLQISNCERYHQFSGLQGTF